MSNIVPVHMEMMLKNLDRLPPHITFQQYLQLRDWIQLNQKSFFKKRNLLFVDLLFETGGRVNDICQLKKEMVDFNQKGLNLWTQKRKKNVFVSLSSETLLDLNLFMQSFPERNPLFGFTRQQGYNLIKFFGLKVGVVGLHPHMFRHGLAIHLLNEGVPLPVISARLGHTNVYITMQNYMKVTPAIQHQHMFNVKMR